VREGGEGYEEKGGAKGPGVSIDYLRLRAEDR